MVNKATGSRGRATVYRQSGILIGSKDVVFRSTSPGSFARKAAEGKIALPQNLRQLPSQEKAGGWYTVESAARLSLLPKNIQVSRNMTVFVQHRIRFKEMREGNEIIRVGVGVYWWAAVQRLKAGIKLAGIEAIAAAVELNLATAVSCFKVVGLVSKRIDSMVPDIATDLNVRAYAGMSKSIDEIAFMWNARGTKVVPEVIYAGEVEAKVERRGGIAGWIMNLI